MAVKSLRVPRHLGAEAKKEWRIVTKALAQAGLLSSCDTATISYHCELVQQQVDVAKEIASEGSTDKRRAEQRRIGTALLKTAAQLALSPYGRHRVALRPGMLEDGAQGGDAARGKKPEEIADGVGGDAMRELGLDLASLARSGR